MDPFTTVSQGVGGDFETFFALLLANVTVKQIDPDSGAATVTTANVPALKRSRRRQPFGVAGGELGQDRCRFVFRVSTAGFTPKARDQVLDAVGITWIVERVELIAFNQLCTIDVVLKR